MVKNDGVTKTKIVYFLLIVVLIVVTIVGDVMVFNKLEPGSDGVKGTVIAVSMIIILLAIVIGAAMFKFVSDAEKESTVKSDKYKKLFLNLPVGGTSILSWLPRYAAA